MVRAGVTDFLLNGHNIPVIDVRSPGEFAEGHITGAFNIPLFSDEERVKVGTTYKQKGRMQAIDLGLDIVGPKMRRLADAAKELSHESQVKVHCWRGGMRSENMAWLFELVGLNVTVLEGGYKSFRNQLLEDFQNLPKLIVLDGPTGSGKTMILRALSKMGEQIIDLEHHANHKGSAFGALGMGPQPTTAQFQNDLYNALLKLDRNKRIWIESESLSIGKVYLPQTLWDTMNVAPMIKVDMPKPIRARRILHEYGHFEADLLASAIGKLQERLGGDRTNCALELLRHGRLLDTVMLLLDYYDKTYDYSKRKYRKQESSTVLCRSADPKINAKIVVNTADELSL